MKDVMALLGGFLTSLLFFFSTIGLKFEWFTQDSINAFVLVIAALVALIINIYAIIKDHSVCFKKKNDHDKK